MLTSLLAAIPSPPTDGVMPKTAETVFNVFIFLPLGAALALAVRHIRGGKGPLLAYCLLGGALAATMEPVVDVLGLVYLKEENALGTFTVLGRTMPLYICFVYPWYVGGLGYLAYKLFANGITTKGLFQLWALDAVADVFLESPGILLNTYSYYGHQPLNPWGFPIWWAFVNPVMPMLAGMAIYKLRPHLEHGSRWKLLGVVPLIPMADGVANGAAAWPMWVTLNQTSVSYVWTYLAALVTLALSLYVVWMISLVVARPATEVADESIFTKLRRLAAGTPSVPASSGSHRPQREPVGSLS